MKLKPCPFCGYRDVQLLLTGPGSYAVSCIGDDGGGCLARGPMFPTKTDARKWWNERAERGTEK